MQSFAFVAPLPLHRPAPCRETSQPSDGTTNPACVAKPPSRTPRSNKVPKANSRKNQSKTTPKSSGSHRTGELTAVELSKKLSRAVGFDIILNDATRLNRLFRSFIKPRSSNQPQQQSNKNSDSDLKSETNLAIRSQPNTYKPKSATAAKIATTYNVARGAFDRAFQSLSIKAQSYVNTFTQIAGDTVYKILSTGHENFPVLGLDRAKDTVKGVLKDGWTPLSVFQWQLSAAPSENLEQRRQARIQQIRKFFRGGTMNFVSATGSTLTGVGKAAEKLAPIMAKGVGKATFGYVERTYFRKLPKSVVSRDTSLRKRQREKTRREQGKYDPYLPKRTSKSLITLETDIAQEHLGTLQLPYPEVASSSASSIRFTTREDRVACESDHLAEFDNSLEGTIANQRMYANKDANKGVQKGNMQLLRNGAIVLAAGAVATAAASVSVSTAITCFTLMVASMALSGAKSANAANLQIHTRYRVRQSRSVQNLEGVISKAQIRPSIQPKAPRALLAPPVKNVQSLRNEATKTTNSFATSAKTVDMPNSDSVEASAYTVSASQPQIMSLPIVGVLLNWLDVMAYHVEGLVGTVMRRCGLWYSRKEETVEWQLLRSFQRNSHPD